MDAFVLGSGFSKAIAPSDMPIVSELVEPLAKHLNGVFGNDRYGQLVRATKDLETILSFFAEDQPWLNDAQNAENRAAFLHSTSWLADHLFQHQRHALGSQCPDWLLKLVDRWHVDRTAVITLNYDLLVESTVATLRENRRNEVTRDGKPSHEELYPAKLPPIRHRYNVDAAYAGESCETFRLLKLHGSLNWAYSPRAEGDGRVFDTGCVDQWERQHPTDWDAVCRSMRDLSPLIVPPVASKSPLFQTNGWMRSIWADAANALAAADRIVVIGYSMPASDTLVRSLLGPRVLAKPLWLVDIDQGCEARFRAMFDAFIDPAWLRTGEAVEQFAQWYATVRSINA